MKLRFESDLPHQRRAIDAAVDLFVGQPYVRLAQAVTAGVVANRFQLDTDSCLAQLRKVQAREGLPRCDKLPSLPGLHGRCFANYSFEMETGTGKTYVYVRTGLELAARYGLRKYIVVVPSVAIREGILSTFEATRSHFGQLYPRLRVRFARYDPRRIDEVREFARSGAVGFLVVTLDALNKQSNLIHRPNDRLQGIPPVKLLQQTRPILLLDEPQNMESPRSLDTLAMLDPLFALRYSATHRRHYALVHRLTPRQAQTDGLVKQVRVTGGLEHSNRLQAWSRRIEETIRVHLDHQKRVRARGVKVLSLFFVDRVADYVGKGAIIPSMFDEHFERLIRADPESTAASGASVRAAYFAQRGDRAIDSKSGKAAEDEAAYRLIMHSKERLLSFDEPVAFVFSHSALREGWDNPNVFQICSLANPKSAIKKRQEIGRGMRLAVDQDGRRVVDQQVNLLTLVVGEDHGQWWRDFEAEQAQAERSTGEDAQLRSPSPSLMAGPAREGDRGAPWVDLHEESLVGRAVARLRSHDASANVGSPRQVQGEDLEIHDVQRFLQTRRPPLIVPRAFVSDVLRQGGAQCVSAKQVGEAIGVVLDEALKRA